MSSVTGPNGAERLARVVGAIPSEHNRQVVERYLEERRANGVKAGTLWNDAHYLRDLCGFLGEKRLEDVAKDDMRRFVANLSRERSYGNGKTRRTVQLAPLTLNQRKVVVKAFYRWLRGTEEYPPEVKWLKPAKSNDTIPADRLVTPEDLLQLLNAVPAEQEWQRHEGRAILAILYEGGLRAGELCALNVGSATFDEWGARLLLPMRTEGLKTGARAVRLFDGETYLRAWLEHHPRKHDPAAPLFLSYGDKTAGTRLGTQGLQLFVKRSERAAGIKKGLHPHLFRHTAVTNDVKVGMTEPELRAKYGWSRSSDMPSRYTHFAGKDYEERAAERKGRKPKSNGDESPLAPRMCPKCREPNLATNLWCGKCKAPLRPEAERGTERERVKAALADILLEALAAGNDEAKLDTPAKRLLDLLGGNGARA